MDNKKLKGLLNKYKDQNSGNIVKMGRSREIENNNSELDINNTSSFSKSITETRNFAVNNLTNSQKRLKTINLNLQKNTIKITELNPNSSHLQKILQKKK